MNFWTWRGLLRDAATRRASGTVIGRLSRLMPRETSR